jgi:hypothetical protein
MQVKNKAAVNAPWVCYIQPLFITAQPLVYYYTFGSGKHRVAYIHVSAWGFGVARFDLQGHSQEPLTVKRATVQGFTLFLCLRLISITNYAV